jgi:hypothetical protein
MSQQRVALRSWPACRPRVSGASRDTLTLASARELHRLGASYQLLYYIRRQTRDDVFVGTDPMWLNLVITSDRADFGRRSSRAIWRGRRRSIAAVSRRLPLNSVEFEEWAATERSRLAARHHVPCLHLAANARRATTMGAIEWWRRLTSLDPLSGRAALD